jgi:hypothetical protein
MPPPLRLPLPPWAPIACSRQERTGLSERQRSARTTGSLAELADLGLPSHDCTVGTALAFCVYVTNEVDRDASMLQAHTVHIHAQAHDVHTHAHTHSHTHTHTHTQTNTNTHIHKHTHTHMHMRTHTYTGAHTHIHTNTNTHKHTHTRTHNLSL